MADIPRNKPGNINAGLADSRPLPPYADNEFFSDENFIPLEARVFRRVRARPPLTQNSIFRCIFQASPESRSNNIFPRGRAEFVTLPAFPPVVPSGSRPEVRRYKLRNRLETTDFDDARGDQSVLFRPSLSTLDALRVPVSKFSGTRWETTRECSKNRREQGWRKIQVVYRWNKQLTELLSRRSDLIERKT